MTKPLPRLYDHVMLWEWSDEHKAFVKLNNFNVGVMEHKVLDVALPFKLE